MTTGSLSVAHLTGLTTALAGRYRLERELGAGGMATVWLAGDVRHERRVAIKVLHPELSAVLGPERFLAEIKTTANLQHPHILPLFDSGSAEGLLFYVMPYVEGETLRARMERERQLPVSDAVRIATEVADALDYAHRHGVVHRDVKPENILLQDGHVVVADFGIALAVEQAGGQRMTQTGLSLGTPQYMAPEQAMGERTVDARADIYAMGAVTYEMLAGEPPFTGPTAQAVVARVMTETPRPLALQRPSVPAHVEAAVMTALEKLPADRHASSVAFRVALTETAAAEGTVPASRRRAPTSAAADVALRRSRRAAAGAALLAVAAAGAAAAAWSVRPSSPAPRVVRLRIALPPGDNTTALRLALTRDGSALGYVDPAPGARGGIYVRRLDRTEPELVAGTTDARTLAFSPDGSALAFVTTSQELRVVAREGSTPVTVARQADHFEGVDWGGDGQLYFVSADSGVVSRVPASGGAVEFLGTLEDSGATSFGFRAHRTPRVLPSGRAVLFGIWRGPGRPGDLGLVDLRTRSTRVLTTGRHVVGIHAGHLLVVSTDGTLRALPFDEDRLEVDGAAVPLLPGIEGQESSSQVALAADGTLAYIPAVVSRSELVWVSRDGGETPVNPSLQRGFNAVAVSPRGDRVALSVEEPDGAAAVWLYDVRQETIAPFARGGALAHRPRWTPDGARLVYVSDRGDAAGIRSLWAQPVDGGDTATVLVRSARHAQEVAFAPDGAWIVYRDGYDDGRSRRDVRYVRPGADTTSRAFAATSADEWGPALSPDGRWLAWVSNESGRYEVYVAAFPGPGGRVVVSQGGGTDPVWARSGRELFYRAGDGRVVAVEFAAGARPELVGRQVLFDASPYAPGTNYATYDVAPDGRFLFIRRPPDPGVEVVVNWSAEIAPRLRDRR